MGTSLASAGPGRAKNWGAVMLVNQAADSTVLVAILAPPDVGDATGLMTGLAMARGEAVGEARSAGQRLDA